ncbi:MAG: RNA polymerase sigma factor [Sandaracinaceae bacterium]
MSIAAAPSLLRLSPNASAEERALVEEIVARLRARDDALLERVLRELFPEVRRWMFRQLGPHGEIDDAVQDALSEIAGALHRFEGRSSLATLARRIALRTSYRYYKRKKPIEWFPEEQLVHDPESQLLAKKALLRLHRALEGLPDRRRAAFILCAVEGMSPSEAAVVLGVSPNAMRSLLCRARQQVEEALTDHEPSSSSTYLGSR